MAGKYRVSAKRDRTYKGNVYHSKLESHYAKYLDMLRNAKLPHDRVISVREQVKYEIVVSGKKICSYILDFEVQYADGRVEYVDVKGVKTDVYRIKKKLVEALFPIKIKEVTKKDFRL